MVSEGIYVHLDLFTFKCTRSWESLDCAHTFYRCVEQLNKASRGDLTPEELKERQVRLLF